MKWESKTTFGKGLAYAAKTWDAARLLMTSSEFSFYLRQAKHEVVAHPIRAVKSVPRTVRALFASEQKARAIDMETHMDPLAEEARSAKLSIVDEGQPLSAQEEIIAGDWSKKIPIVRNFNNAARVFLNKVRLDSYKQLRASLGREPTPVEAAAIADFVNAATGRGRLPDSMERSAVMLGRIMFAPRFLVSRFQYGLMHSIWPGQGTNATRKVIATEYARAIAGQAAYIALLAMYFKARGKDVSVETDPRSSDFLKVKVGDTRIDTMAGLVQIATLLARIIPTSHKGQWGQWKKTGSGEYKRLGGYPNKPKFGEDTAANVVGRFARSKAHPFVGTVWNLLSGTTMAGDELTVRNSLLPYIVPITYLDITEAAKEHDLPDATTMAILAWLGESIQTYERKQKTTGGPAVPRAPSIETPSIR